MTAMESLDSYRHRTAWMIAGAIVTFAVVSGFSIGLGIAPFALLVAWVALRRSGFGPEMFGILDGAAAICLLIALFNHNGGLDPVPWLVAGCLLAVAGFTGYRVGRHLQSRDA
jgi:hypothetical protein